MLKVPAPYPFPGSFALFVDDTLPVGQQRAELVRIVRRTVSHATIAFPLRPDVASGHRTVHFSDLHDATPLTKEEERAMHDAHRAITGVEIRTPRQRAARDRFADLRARSIGSIILASELAKLEARENRLTRRHGGSAGQQVAA